LPRSAERELAAARDQTGADGGGAGPASAGQAQGSAAGPAREPAGLDEVRTASEISALAAAALRVAVDLARGAGPTWQELGDILGVTRQAAFQRFGHPVDPRTGELMSSSGIPGAAERATQLMIDWIEAATTPSPPTSTRS
jgi:hypothetical protein